MGDNQRLDGSLVLEKLLDLVYSVQPLSFALDVLGLVLVVVGLLADEELFLEALLGLLRRSGSTLLAAGCVGRSCLIGRATSGSFGFTLWLHL